MAKNLPVLFAVFSIGAMVGFGAVMMTATGGVPSFSIVAVAMLIGGAISTKTFYKNLVSTEENTEETINETEETA